MFVALLLLSTINNYSAVIIQSETVIVKIVFFPELSLHYRNENITAKPPTQNQLSHRPAQKKFSNPTPISRWSPTHFPHPQQQKHHPPPPTQKTKTPTTTTPPHDPKITIIQPIPSVLLPKTFSGLHFCVASIKFPASSNRFPVSSFQLPVTNLHLQFYGFSIYNFKFTLSQIYTFPFTVPNLHFHIYRFKFTLSHLQFHIYNSTFSLSQVYTFTFTVPSLHLHLYSSTSTVPTLLFHRFSSKFAVPSVLFHVYVFCDCRLHWENNI